MKKEEMFCFVACIVVIIWFIIIGFLGFREPEYELVSRTSSISIDGDVTEGVTLRDKLTGNEKDIYWEVGDERRHDSNG